MIITIDTSEWQTQAQAAKNHGCHKQRIRTMIDAGQIKSLKIPDIGVEWVAKPMVIEAKGHFSSK